MLNVCCAPAARDAQVGHVAKEDGAAMDLARLRELYNRSKETQRLQTRVILRGKASKKEDVGGKSLVNVVPISQEVRNCTPFEEQMPVKRILFNLAADLDSDNILWRTHLGMHRMSSSVQRGGEKAPAGRAGGQESAQTLICVERDKAYEEATRAEKSGETLSERRSADADCWKLTGPTPLSRRLRRLSLSGNQLQGMSSSSQHYPFPQRKWQKKSEAARRLGMYSVTGEE